MSRQEGGAVSARISKRVRAQRLKLGISQADLAERCGWHQTTIGRIEQGRMAITCDQLFVLASALGDKPGRMLGIR